MNIRLPRCILLGAALLLLATAVPAPARVIELQRHENREFHFAFQYPASWQLSPVTGGDLRARVSAPDGGPTAQCSVIVKQFPNAAEARQAEIDQVFLAPPTAAEIREMLGAEIPELEVLSVATTTLHTRPAHQAALRYPLPALVGTLPAYGRVVLTATPGLTWTISCNGKGATPAEAERNFAFWNQEIDAIIASFRFLSAKPSPAAVPAAAAKAPATTPDKK